MATANRGKQAETILKQHLAKLSKQADTIFSRLPDAHAGSYAVALADFLLMHRGDMFLIECKQVNHAYRLPHGNFGPDQVARMRAWQLAGAKSLVLVYHTPIDAWRGFPVDHFLVREGGSWDLRGTPAVKLEDLL